MSETQTVQASEAPPAPREERAARHLRLLARMAEIQMDIAEAARTEAVEAPQPGIDYCQRIAVVARSLRLTLLLEDKLSRPPEERPHEAAIRRAERSRSRLRVTMAMGAAVTDGAELPEATRRFAGMAERLERPELAELVETSPAPVAVARLCRMFGLPEEAERWLDLGDAALAEMAARPSAGTAAAPGAAPAPGPAEPVVDQAGTRRRLRVIMALGAAIRAGTGDEAESDRRFFEMAGQMDRPDLAAIADSCPAAEAVARLCPEFGLPPEQAERWVAESDLFLATMDLPPEDPPEPPDTG
ncbi:hypothetical protein [Inquilinus sp. Marseille-Q2685]|uniref:hypothetical protein n=1 Tax=Inquilinus sp. Marseille-Q2685 TaxID=2866581 RepID=UPI001CE3DF14|nr:hypothetical protein [Inquilinus sp. Marseille-Q2685]